MQVIIKEVILVPQINSRRQANQTSIQSIKHFITQSSKQTIQVIYTKYIWWILMQGFGKAFSFKMVVREITNQV
jgi:hypothetical protein